MPSEVVSTHRTLNNNCIRNFILRIDLLPEPPLEFETIISGLSSFFDRTEKKIIDGVVFKLVEGTLKSEQVQDYEYILVSDSRKLSMTFSKPQSAFWLSTSSYQNNKVYKEIFEKIQQLFIETYPSSSAKRIGMRFINDFKCDSQKHFSRIFKNDRAKIVSGLLADNGLNRAIAYQEYNCEGSKAKIQYGIMNKFYPSVISGYDLILDIDTFIDIQINNTDWTQKISELNHSAYDFFIKIINEKYLERLS